MIILKPIIQNEMEGEDFSWLLSFISPKIATKLTNLLRRYEDFGISVLEKTNGNNITDEVSTFFALTYFKYVI